MRLMFQTTSIRTERKRALPLVVLPERRLPPLCVLSGHTPAHEARCLAEGKRLISTPISARIAAAAICLHAGNAQEQLPRLLTWAQPLLDLQLELLHTVFQVAHVSKELPKQHPVLRLA